MPLCLGGLVTYFAQQENELISKEYAYYYATGIVVFSIIPVLVFHPFIFYIFQMGIKIRVGCSSLIYKKVSGAKFFSFCPGDRLLQ